MYKNQHIKSNCSKGCAMMLTELIKKAQETSACCEKYIYFFSSLYAIMEEVVIDKI